MFFFGAISLLFSIKLPERLHPFVLTATAMSGVVIVNSYFTWPKLLGTGLALAALASLVDLAKSEIRSARQQIICGLLIGFSLLAHTSHVFALIGFVLAMCLILITSKNRKNNLQPLVSVLLTAGLVNITWSMFQNFFDPPGNRLAKWHLAGIKEINPDGVIQSIVQEYGQLTFSQWVSYKVQNFERMLLPIWDPDNIAGTPTSISHSNLVAPWNFGESFSDYWITAGEVVLLIAIVPAIYWWVINLAFRRFFTSLHTINPQMKNLREFALLSLAIGLSIWAILIFLPGTTYVFHASLIFAVLPILVSVVTSAIELPALVCRVGLIVQIAGTLSVYWISKPISWAMSHRFEPVPFTLAALSLVILVSLSLWMLSSAKNLDPKILMQ